MVPDPDVLPGLTPTSLLGRLDVLVAEIIQMRQPAAKCRGCGVRGELRAADGETSPWHPSA